MDNEEWTRDAAGEYVRWNEPPYRKANGQLSLFLSSERPGDVTSAEHQKRIMEYYKLIWRAG